MGFVENSICERGGSLPSLVINVGESPKFPTHLLLVFQNGTDQCLQKCLVHAAFTAVPIFYIFGPTSVSTYRSFATRVSQLKIWHFLVIGIERDVCGCTLNRHIVIKQSAKLAAGEQLCRRCTHSI